MNKFYFLILFLCILPFAVLYFGSLEAFDDVVYADVPTIVDDLLIDDNVSSDDIDKDILAGAYAVAVIESSFDDFRACGWITKRTIELCAEKGVTAYSVYTVTPLGEHLSPAIRLSDFSYFAYEQNRALCGDYDGRLISYDYQLATKEGLPKGAVYIPNDVIYSSSVVRVCLEAFI